MPKIFYRVKLSQEERAELEEISKHGNHGSQKVLDALILLGVDEGEFQTSKKTASQLADVLPISTKKVERVKKDLLNMALKWH